MENPTAPATIEAPTDAAPASAVDAPTVESEMLIEEISIDGMCGVY